MMTWEVWDLFYNIAGISGRERDMKMKTKVSPQNKKPCNNALHEFFSTPNTAYCNHVIGKHTKLTVTTKYLIPTLCYQFQKWTFTANHKRKLVTIEMRCLRKATGVTRSERIKDIIIRERIGPESALNYIPRIGSWAATFKVLDKVWISCLGE